MCSLGSNHLGSEGAKHLSEGLKANGVLQPLEYAASRPVFDCQQPLTPAASLLTCSRVGISLGSVSNNNLTNYGEDMSAVLKLAEVLPKSQLQSLR